MKPPYDTIHLLPVAYDGGGGLPGCAEAPATLFDLGLEAACRRNGRSVVQAPMVRPAPGTRWETLSVLLRTHAAQVAQAIHAGHLPVIIGGDHSIAAGTWRGVGRGLGEAPGLIWIDAHLDAHTPDTTPSGNPHGMPLAALLGYGAADMKNIEGPALNPERVVVIGIRSWETEERRLLDALGVRCYDMADIERLGLRQIMQAAVERARGGDPEGRFGLSLDLDAVDPNDAPAVGTPVAAGISGCDLFATLRGLADQPGFCALELVEYNPKLDVFHRAGRFAVDMVGAILDGETEACIVLEAEYGARNYAPLPVVLCRGEGAYLWDVDGKRYLDFMSAYSAVSFGHANSRLVAALTAQAGRLAVTSRAFHNDRLPLMLERLCTTTGMDRALPVNTGLEAVETALKAARKWGEKVKGIEPGQTEIIACEGNFHGRSIAIVGLSTEAQYRDGFGPFPSGLRTIPYADARALEAAITPDTAAFLVEPIQGEGGIRVPPPGYLAACADICRRHNVLLIADEVQTGLGRTGKLLACEYEGVQPDGLCLGKALGGGLLPVSAFLARHDVMAVFTPGDHGSTFGGNALSAAVALEALALLEDAHLVERAAELGAHLMRRLAPLRNYVGVRDIRGRGLLVGIDLDPQHVDAHQVCEAMMRRGVLSKETHATVIRIAPPLTITRDELDAGIDVLTETLGEFCRLKHAA